MRVVVQPPRGIKLHEVISDPGFSAKSLRRPGIVKLLEGVKQKRIDRVIILNLSRITRSVGDLCSLLDQFSRSGCELISISETLDTSSAVGKLLVHMLGSINQFSREMGNELTAATLSTLRAKKQVYGPVPYGYVRVGDILVEDDETQRTLALIRNWRDEGKSPYAIANELNERKVPPPSGQRRKGKQTWYPSSVKAILESKMASHAA